MNIKFIAVFTTALVLLLYATVYLEGLLMLRPTTRFCNNQVPFVFRRSITTENRALLSAIDIGLLVLKRCWENDRKLAALRILTEIVKLCGYSAV